MFKAKEAKALAARPAIPRLPLSLAKQVEARRYNRIAEFKQVVGTVQLQHDIARSVELHNQTTALHRMEDLIHTGVPTSIAHPIQRELASMAAARAARMASRAATLVAEATTDSGGDEDMPDAGRRPRAKAAAKRVDSRSRTGRDQRGIAKRLREELEAAEAAGL